MTSHSQPIQPYVLGIDLGANSLGWAAIAVDPDGQPIRLLETPDQMRIRPTMGVRIFDEGVENYGQGQREGGRGQKRRGARLQRRQAMRRSRRQSKVFSLLQRAGLLPEFDVAEFAGGSPRDVARDQLLKRLDEQLSHALAAGAPKAEATLAFEVLPYVLRSDALDRELSQHELGRALYHLAQRRGFLSNRKAGKKDEDVGVVKQAIARLEQEMRDAGSRTLGEHLAREAQAGRRLRGRWTARRMYQDEFDAMWAAQSSHHPEALSVEFKKRMHRALFFQRPLRSQRDLIGLCALENGDEYVRPGTGEVTKSHRRRRAPECLLISQRFRLLQKVNDLGVDTQDGLPARLLDVDQRMRLAKELDREERLTFAAIARLLGLPRGTRFNLQAGGEKDLRGNRTNAQLLRLFGTRWERLTSPQRDLVVLEIWSAPDDAVLVRRARERLGIWAALETTPSEASVLSDIALGTEYMSLSRRAMDRLVPILERGVPYTTAVQEAYGDRVRRESLDSLPPVHQALGTLRNPAVARALTELRKVVNHLIRLHGKPIEIRVELARDLKRSKDERNRLIRQNRENEDIRRQAAEKIVREAGLTDPRGSDILRVRLAEECGWVCPYSGRSISMAQLMGGEIDIEHIIPFSFSLDDSYINKTLCFADVNRNQKQNRSPHEAFGHDSERWAAMLQRMEHSTRAHRMPAAKLERFRLAGDAYVDALERFKSVQLNDTRYASLRAKEYLALLYGGNVSQGTDSTGRRRIVVGNGQATALVRRQIGIEAALKRVLGHTGAYVAEWNKRTDHRHHAVDAVAIALTGPSMIQKLSRAAEGNREARRRAVGSLAAPWDAFEDDIVAALEPMAISFRIDNPASGPLHAETLYSPRFDAEGRPNSNGGFSHIRKPVDKLSASDFDKIVDPSVRETVVAFFAGRDPAKVCKLDDPSTYPFRIAADGRRIPIRRVRVRKKHTTFAVGSAHRTRNVENEANHHLCVRDSIDKTGTRRVSFSLVSMLEAVRRKATKTDVVKRDGSITFTLSRNDVVELDDGEGHRRLCRITALTEVEWEGCWSTDARQRADRDRTGGRVRVRPGNVLSRECRKVTISPIGVVRPCRA